MKKIFSEVNIGKLGVLEVKLPLIKIGFGKPKVLLLVGIHGNEQSGLLIIKKLLSKVEKIQGTITIIPSANPLAQALNTREATNDLKDLNRSFPGNNSESMTAKIAAVIFNIAKSNDFVIDLHTFENLTPITGIFMNSGTTKTKKGCLNLSNCLKPDIIWKLSPLSENERHFQGSLGPKLAEIGIINTCIEMPEHFRISNDQIDRISQGIIDVSQHALLRKKINIPVFDRRVVKATNSGLFTSKRKLLEKITNGEIIGELTSIDRFETTIIKSPFEGILIEIKNNSIVNPGETIFTVGNKVSTL